MDEVSWLALLAIALVIVLAIFFIGLVRRRKRADIADIYALIFTPAGLVGGAKMTVFSWNFPAMSQGLTAASLLDPVTMFLSGAALAVFAIFSALVLIFKAWSP
ncbi:hypothetical protein N7I30_04455 [Aurantimonas litoralis]|nr:hypothetical protein [Aurantimonas litoralis]